MFMKLDRNTKIGILFLLLLFVSLLFYTQYLALNSNSLSLLTSAKVSIQSPAPTCAPPPLRCPKGSTCNNQSKTCVSQGNQVPTGTQVPTGIQPTAVIPITFSPTLKEGQLCVKGHAPIGVCGTGLYCNGYDSCNKKSDLIISDATGRFDEYHIAYDDYDDGVLLFTNIYLKTN